MIIDDLDRDGVHDPGERGIIAEAEVAYEVTEEGVSIVAPDVVNLTLFTSTWTDRARDAEEFEFLNNDVDILSLIEGDNHVPESLNIKLGNLLGEMNEEISNATIGSEGEYYVEISGIPLQNEADGSDIDEITGRIVITEEDGPIISGPEIV